ncbi:MAG: 50S ribosomal protein L3 [Calditrichaeota bacterium]|nr:50S ribosomal protein L3 [Calditrichota bacterium]MCB0295918.1 50S ribosomal protein L3 [Calditrichota bacterium]MCB0302705.1 50S ribosomal protein L3 [Calditrichota bacterium]
MSGLLGKKIGMTRIFDDKGNAVPVTVVQAGPCFVTQVKTVENDGYNAVQLGYDPKKEKNTTKPILGHLKKANVPALRVLKEFKMAADVEVKLGDVVKADIFQAGEMVKVSGWSKGRGFTGVIKRHNFGGGRKTHGQSDRYRAPGSIGQSSYPSKVFKGTRMAGRTGNRYMTVKGLRIVKVDAENNLIFVKGAIPGARNSYVEIYKQR